MLVAECRRAAQPHSDPREQLVEGERLREVVGRTQLEAAQLRLHVAARGEDHDGQLRLGAVELPQDLQPVQPRQQKVEHDEVPARSVREVEPLASVAGRDAVYPSASSPRTRND